MAQGIEKIHESGTWPNTADIHSITLITVLRNESLLIDAFIDHYRESGVSQFVFIDNDSTDDTLERIKSYSINARILKGLGSYLDANFGTDWINSYLRNFCIGCYCLIVDTDELLICSDRKRDQLMMLASNMSKEKSCLIPALLVDMYPQDFSIQYRSGENPTNHSRMFDSFNTDYYRKGSWRGLFGRYHAVFGGVRSRMFGLDQVMLIKFPLFKFMSEDLSIGPGCHSLKYEDRVIRTDNILYPVSSQPPIFLLHFKYLRADLRGYFAERAGRNQDWENSTEYRKYLEYICQHPEQLDFIDPRYSTAITSYSQLLTMFGELLD